MGFIPETVTRRLPSSVVGTLGVDTSGEKLGQAVAAAGEKVFGAVTQKVAERKRTLDIIAAQAKIRQYESDMDGISSVNKGNFKDNPKGGVDKTFEDGETLLNSTLEGIEDESVRAMVAQGTTSSLRRSGNQMKGWAHQQEVVNGAFNYSQVTNISAEQLSKNPDVDLMEEFIVNEFAREDQAKMLFGKDWPTAQKQQIQSIMKGQISGLELKDPITGLRFLKEYDFKGAFTSDEMKKFEKDMKSSVTGWNEKIKFDKGIDTLNLFDGAAEKFKRGEFDVQFVDQLEIEMDDNGLLSPEVQDVIDDLRKIAAENTDPNSVHSTEIFNKLNDELRNLEISSDKMESDAKLAALFKFRANVYKASANGNILPRERQSFLDQIITPSGDKIEKDQVNFGKGILGAVTFGWFGKTSTPEGAAFDKVNNWLGEMNFSEEVSAKAKGNILSKAYIEMTELNKSGTAVSIEDVEGIVEPLIREELARQNDILQHIPAEGKAIRLKSGEKVLILPSGIRIPIK